MNTTFAHCPIRNSINGEMEDMCTDITLECYGYLCTHDANFEDLSESIENCTDDY